MKYIRTKDGHIYCHPDFGPRLAKVGIGLPTEVYLDVIYKMRHFQVKEQDVINQADTIEELCDEFVVVANYGIGYGAKPAFIEKENVSRFLNSYGEWTIYGAIWTDKGLIYAAKMNEKGELELL